MSKLYCYSAIAAILGFPAFVNAASILPKENLPHPSSRNKIATSRNFIPASSRKGISKRSPMRIEEPQENGFWVAGTTVSYFSVGEDDWMVDSSVTSTYNSLGLLVREEVEDLLEGGISVIDYTYEDNNRDFTAEARTGVNLNALSPDSKMIRAFDPIVPELCVKSYRYEWFAGTQDWVQLSTSYYRDIERDAAGNITAVHYYTYYQNDFEEVQRFIVEYTDGKPSVLTEYRLSYDHNQQEYWQMVYSYRDCQWYATNGQVYDFDCIFGGDNKIKSYSQYKEEGLYCTLEVVYEGDSDDFTCTAHYADGAETVQVWENLADGGYQNDIIFSIPGEEEKIEMLEREEYNKLGYLTLGYAIEYYGDYPELYSWEEAECELNEDDLPVSYILRALIPLEDEAWRPRRSAALTEPPVEGYWEDEMKFLFGDFQYIVPETDGVDAAGVNEAAAEYFSIDGLRVDPADAKGLLIRRQGNVVNKVLKK